MRLKKICQKKFQILIWEISLWLQNRARKTFCNFCRGDFSGHIDTKFSQIQEEKFVLPPLKDKFVTFQFSSRKSGFCHITPASYYSCKWMTRITKVTRQKLEYDYYYLCIAGVPAESGEIRAVKNASFLCVFKTSKRWMTKPSKGAAGSWYRHIPTELRFLRHFKGVWGQNRPYFTKINRYEL